MGCGPVTKIDATDEFLAAAGSAVEIALQPIAAFGSGDVRAYEALVRGADRMGCFGPPDLFRRAVEADALFAFEGLLSARAMAAFRAIGGGMGRTRLFLNLHGGLLPDWARVAERLAAQAAAAGLSTSDVCIELSEANQTLPADRMADAVAGLRAPGFAIAIDDFGTGQSGLHMLYGSDPDYLKIDRFFIQGMPADAKKRLFVGSVVELAHTLGMQVIAEGIETDAEGDACRLAGCDLAQGYRVARPTTDLGALRTRYTQGGTTAPLPAGPADRVDLSDYAEPGAMTVFADMPVEAALDILRQSRRTRTIPVLDDALRPVGVLREGDLRAALFSPFAAHPGGAEGATHPVRSLAVRIPVVNRRARLAPLLDMLAAGAGDGLLLVDAGVYAGYIGPAALVRLANEARLVEAARQNPLTRLPGPDVVTERLACLAANGDEARIFAAVDLTGLRTFNDRHGFDVGDRALKLCATKLRALGTEQGAFVGHRGGDFFVVAASGDAVPPVTWALDAFADRFTAAARALHGDEDRTRGWLPGRAPDDRLPLLGARVVALTLAAGTLATGAEIGTGLSDLRAEARAAGTRTILRPWRARRAQPAAGGDVVDLPRSVGS